jgi:hypothetical protein
MRSGRAYQRPPLVPRTSDTGSSLLPTVTSWPTPQAHDAAPGNPARVGRYGTEHGGRNLNDEAAMWPTPLPSDVLGGRTTKGKSRQNETGLRRAVWPTPTADDANNGTRESVAFQSLTRAVRLPTPQARDHRSGRAKKNYGNSRPLNEQVLFPTPRGGTEGVGMIGGAGAWRAMERLESSGVVSHSERMQMSAGNGGQLNPTWVEWLMGFPLGWTVLKHWVTRSSRKSLRTSDVGSSKRSR